MILFANDDHEEFFEAYRKIATEFRKSLKFTFSKPNDASGLFARLAEYIGAS